jgi:hypothetical protein
MRLRRDNFFATDTQYRIQKRILLPYAVVSGVQIYHDTLAKKYCFFTDELGRIERPRSRYSQLLVDLASYLLRAANHFPVGFNYLRSNHAGSSAS